MDTPTPISAWAISIYIHATTIRPKSNMGHATISIWNAPVPHMRGTPDLCIRQDGTSSTRSIGHHSIESSGTGPARLSYHSVAKADQSGSGAYIYNDRENDKKGHYQNRYGRCAIREDNEVPMIFGELASTSKREDMTAIKIADPKYSMPRWCPSGLTRSQKRRL
jgi:hypothetical protein